MNEPEQSTGAEEYLQAEIFVEGIDSPSVEKQVHSALEALPSLQILSIDTNPGKIRIRYDPLLTTRADIDAAITRSGVQIRESHIEDSSVFDHPDIP